MGRGAGGLRLRKGVDSERLGPREGLCPTRGDDRPPPHTSASPAPPHLQRLLPIPELEGTADDMEVPSLRLSTTE